MGKWFGKDQIEVPPELESLTPEQIIAAARESQTMKTQLAELDAMKTKLAAAEARGVEVDTLKNQIATMQTQLDSHKPPANGGGGEGEGNGRPKSISFLDDEDAAFNQRATPLVQAVLAVGAQTAQMGFKSSLDGLDKRIFEKYGSEVEDLMSKEPMNNQASPKAWQTGFEIVKGRHAVDIAKAAQEKTDFFSETSTGTFSAGPGNLAPKQDEITDDEKKLAAKYGLKPEEYLAQKKEMVIYHG